MLTMAIPDVAISVVFACLYVTAWFDCIRQMAAASEVQEVGNLKVDSKAAAIGRRGTC